MAKASSRRAESRRSKEKTAKSTKRRAERKQASAPGTNGRPSSVTGKVKLTSQPNHRPSGEVNAWGEQAYPDLPYAGFASSGLFIPKQGREEPDATFSPAVGARAQASLGVHLTVLRPDTNIREVFNRLDFVDVRDSQKTFTKKSATKAMYSAPESMGIASAFFRTDKERDDARSELEDDYEYVEDFPLSLPCRVNMDESPSNRRHATGGIIREWPQASGVDRAHSSGIRGAGVLLAVLDTGVDADHQEFTGKRITYRFVSFFPNNSDWPPRDVRGFDTDGHGTHVCGILWGRSVGIAPESQLHVASVIESETTLTSITRVVAGLQWVTRQFARPENERLPAVLNMSLGFPAALNGPSAAAFGQRLKTMRLILQALVKANVLTVAAIGNEGKGKYGFPGAFPEAVGVGAVGFNESLGSFSGSGPVSQMEGIAKPDVVGYGVGVNSSIERDYDNQSIYQRLNGTSMAAPYVAGIATLIRSRQPTLTVGQTIQELQRLAKPLPVAKRLVGAGLARFQ